MTAGNRGQGIHFSRRFLKEEQIGLLAVDQCNNVLDRRADETQQVPTDDFHDKGLFGFKGLVAAGAWRLSLLPEFNIARADVKLSNQR